MLCMGRHWGKTRSWSDRSPTAYASFVPCSMAWRFRRYYGGLVAWAMPWREAWAVGWGRRWLGLGAQRTGLEHAADWGKRAPALPCTSGRAPTLSCVTRSGTAIGEIDNLGPSQCGTRRGAPRRLALPGRAYPGGAPKRWTDRAAPRRSGCEPTAARCRRQPLRPGALPGATGRRARRPGRARG